MIDATSPWRTVNEAAEYARRHRNYILAALHAEELKAGSGLKGRQPGGKRKGCIWLIHINDLDAWIEGKSAPRRLGRTA